MACGGGQSEAKTGAEEPKTETPAAASGEEEMSAEEAALLEQIEESAGEADAAATTESGEEGREVVYRVAPEGMKIQIDGAEFIPKAKAVKIGKGWGVELSVEATTEQDRILWSPMRGPLAFGGFVERGGQKEKFGDIREGGVDAKLIPGASLQFKRTWPLDGQPGLLAGEKLELHVGLWGFGPDTAGRKPVRRFLVVKMSASASGAHPVIEPPAQ